jgi:hypothetical protein
LMRSLTGDISLREMQQLLLVSCYLVSTTDTLGALYTETLSQKIFYLNRIKTSTKSKLSTLEFQLSRKQINS